MFTNLNKKIITGAVAASIAISSIAAIPSFALAHEGKGKDKDNFGKTVRTWAHFKHDDDNEHFGMGLGIGKIVSSDVLATVSQDSIKIFREEMKDAIKDKKEAQKEAKVTLKASLQTADTPEEKKSAVKTFLNSILSAFHIFADAKESALTKFINSF